MHVAKSFTLVPKKSQRPSRIRRNGNRRLEPRCRTLLMAAGSSENSRRVTLSERKVRQVSVDVFEGVSLTPERSIGTIRSFALGAVNAAAVPNTSTGSAPAPARAGEDGRGDSGGSRPRLAATSQKPLRSAGPAILRGGLELNAIRWRKHRRESRPARLTIATTSPRPSSGSGSAGGPPTVFAITSIVINHRSPTRGPIQGCGVRAFAAV